MVRISDCYAGGYERRAIDFIQKVPGNLARQSNVLSQAMAAALGISTLAVPAVTSEPGIDWVAKNAPWSPAIADMAYGNGVWVGIPGDAGNNGAQSSAILTSTDGVTWQRVDYVFPDDGVSRSWNTIVFANGRFVAVARHDASVVKTIGYSDDGLNWTFVDAPTGYYGIAALCYGAGKFVAFSRTLKTVLTSTDGATWVNEGSIPAAMGYITCAVYGGTTFIAVAQNGTSRGMKSTDGVTWTTVGIDATKAWSSVTYGGGLFVAASFAIGTGSTKRSATGDVWTDCTLPVTTAQYPQVSYGNGMFVLTSPSTSIAGANNVLTSPNGSTWTARSVPLVTMWDNVRYGNGTWVVASQNGFSPQLMSSTDNGVTWTVTSEVPSAPSTDVAVNGDTIVVTGIYGSRRVVCSTDGGTTWSAVTTPLREWNSVAYGAGLFVAVAYGGYVMTSPDGITWTSQTPPNTANWSRVTYANGRFVAVANGGTGRQMWSTDGITWTVATTPIDAGAWYGVTYGAGLFVAVGGSGYIATSPDGQVWTRQTTGVSAAVTFGGVAFGNGLFVAVGSSGTGNRVATSTDGITWTHLAVPDNAWSCVAFGGGRWVIMGYTSGTNGPPLLVSDDNLATWSQPVGKVTNANWRIVKYEVAKFWAVSSIAYTPGGRVYSSP